jgi:hypothetical protein
MNKVKKILLILNNIILIGLGIMIANLSNISYRHSRLGIYTQSNKLINDFYSEFNKGIIITWICWGVAFAFSILQTYLEFRRENISKGNNE